MVLIAAYLCLLTRNPTTGPKFAVN